MAIVSILYSMIILMNGFNLCRYTTLLFNCSILSYKKKIVKQIIIISSIKNRHPRHIQTCTPPYTSIPLHTTPYSSLHLHTTLSKKTTQGRILGFTERSLSQLLVYIQCVQCIYTIVFSQGITYKVHYIKLNTLYTQACHDCF